MKLEKNRTIIMWVGNKVEPFTRNGDYYVHFGRVRCWEGNDTITLEEDSYSIDRVEVVDLHSNLLTSITKGDVLQAKYSVGNYFNTKNVARYKLTGKVIYVQNLR